MNTFLFKCQTYSKLVSDMLGEAWTDQRKAEVDKLMKGRGFSKIDHGVFGDYDLVLWEGEAEGELKGVYVVSLNNAQYDPGSMADQWKTPAPKSLRIDPVLGKLREWSDKYGKLLVSSANSYRLDAYRRILSNHFILADYSHKEPKRGFFILPD